MLPLLPLETEVETKAV